MNINEISVAYIAEKEQRRRASTVDGYRSSINLYILPEFGNCEIETIEPEEIQAWVDGFAKPGAAEKAFKCPLRLSWLRDASGHAGNNGHNCPRFRLAHSLANAA